MGLFNFLKNGLQLEVKKQKEEETIAEEETPIDETEDVTEEATETPAETPAAETADEKRLEAEYILYGDTNVVPHTQTPPVSPVPTPAPASTQHPTLQTFNPYSSNVTSSFNSALLGQTSASQNLLVVEPKSPEDLSAILSNLASGNACIVSLAKIATPQRHLDYICGFMNAIGGTIMQRTQTEYILTPKGVGIKS